MQLNICMCHQNVSLLRGRAEIFLNLVGCDKEELSRYLLLLSPPLCISKLDCRMMSMYLNTALICLDCDIKIMSWERNS